MSNAFPALAGGERGHEKNATFCRAS